MLDAYKTVLAIGDIVAFCQPNYPTLRIGTVLRFTPQQVVIDTNKRNHRGRRVVIHRNSDQVAIVHAHL